MVYLIHFHRKYKHAQHYLGFVQGKLDARLKRHKAGGGAKLLRAVNAAGILWDVVRTWPDGDRNYERWLKNKKNTASLCPICNKNISHENES